MGLQLVAVCDPCEKQGTRTEATVIDIAVRSYAPTDPGQDADDPVRGTIVVCKEHGAPVSALAELVKVFGTNLTREAAEKLTAPSKAIQQAAAEWFECHEPECVVGGIPKRYRKGSVPTHVKRTHDRARADVDIRPVPVNGG